MPTLDVLYDDGPCLVVNKPSGLLTQAPRGIDSLEIWVRNFWKSREEKAGDDNIYVGIIHRLDRPVSGATLFARHVRAAQRLSAQFQQRTVSKTYWAVVEGCPSDDEGTWTDCLHKRHGMAQAIVVPEDDPRGKHAVLHYRVLQRWDQQTLLEITLETGRTHQIRVQASSRGLPVLGDEQYGATRLFGPETDEPRDRAIALHARELGFRHAMRDEQVQITAPLPSAWEALELAPTLL
ncbi:Ribosomal large subunit pseudouridine synthase D [Posidoniimonas polymericola]|uniref:Ribosomal large subunit pseudouridine synthase D n=1 Tax=Posidoniimonas polymericola TaxID=2528002 RepID=A0A5C5YPN0_9BACT|nr:RNA pseudouridine synthase [Posidoniimonas polymericola]TWT76922.1 Ribosomal large subunit pseudouridine synthase D [Posidoniimonas polymericola]